jgi:hypothetical protein
VWLPVLGNFRKRLRHVHNVFCHASTLPAVR